MGRQGASHETGDKGVGYSGFGADAVDVDDDDAAGVAGDCRRSIKVCGARINTYARSHRAQN